MMKFTELLTPEHIRQGVIFSSKKRLFESIAAFVVDELSCEKGEQACFECLFNREKLGNSGLGNGVAMPKGKLPEGIEQPIALFLQLDSPIDYDAADGKPVDLVFALLVPQTNCSRFVPVLSAISEKLTDKLIAKQLRAAQSAVEIWQIFQQIDGISSETTETAESESNAD